MSKTQKTKRKIVKSNADVLPEAEFFGTALVGTKGQIVIPKDAREKYGINTGDNVIIFGTREKVLAIIKADKLNEILTQLGTQIDLVK